MSIFWKEILKPLLIGILTIGSIPILILILPLMIIWSIGKVMLMEGDLWE